MLLVKPPKQKRLLSDKQQEALHIVREKRRRCLHGDNGVEESKGVEEVRLEQKRVLF